MNRETWRDGKLVALLVDNGDGTGVLYTFAEDGVTIVDTQDVVDLPIEEITPEDIPPVEIPIPDDVALRMREAFDSIATGNLTVTKLKLAMQAAIDAIGETP